MGLLRNLGYRKVRHYAGGMTAIYFSFVTALSIGYGDVTPVGPLRVLAIVEGAAGLLIFGCVISKLVSRRQETLTQAYALSLKNRMDQIKELSSRIGRVP